MAQDDKVTRKLAAILSADMVGYSRLMEADEEGTIARQKVHREKLIDPQIAEHRGRIVNVAGDGLLVEFSSVVDAVQCAVEVQRALESAESKVSPDRRIRYRVGINLGDIVIDEDDILGDGVNVAARLQELAKPGEILISGTAFDQVKKKIGLGYRYRGYRKVKNITEPVRIYLILTKDSAAGRVIGTGWNTFGSRGWAVALVLLAVATAAIWRPWAPALDTASIDKMAFPLPKRPSIAVLPFRNLSGKTAQDIFSSGVTEGIITALSKISAMFVVASTSTFVYKGRAVKLRTVAEELGVRYILEGSIQRTTDTVRVNVRLTDSIKGNVIWSDSYQGEASDIFALQDKITLRIITGLQVQLTEGEQERVALSHGTTNLKAWEYASQGSLLLRRLKLKDNTRARELYTLATKLDPDYPGAWGGVAWTHLLAARFGWSTSPADSLSKAEGLARKALALDTNRPGTYILLGHIYLTKGDHERAVAFGEKSVGLSPSGAEALAILAVTYSYAGQPKRAIGLLKKAMRLSPYYPGYYLWTLGRAYRLTGDRERAISAFTQHLKRDPDSLVSRVELVITQAELGRMTEAREAAKAVLRIDPTFSTGRWEPSLTYKDRAVTKREIAALRKAGLPE